MTVAFRIEAPLSFAHGTPEPGRAIAERHAAPSSTSAFSSVSGMSLMS